MALHTQNGQTNSQCHQSWCQWKQTWQSVALLLVCLDYDKARKPLYYTHTHTHRSLRNMHNLTEAYVHAQSHTYIHAHTHIYTHTHSLNTYFKTSTLLKVTASALPICLQAVFAFSIVNPLCKQMVPHWLLTNISNLPNGGFWAEEFPATCMSPSRWAKANYKINIKNNNNLTNLLIT